MLGKRNQASNFLRTGISGNSYTALTFKTRPSATITPEKGKGECPRQKANVVNEHHN